MKRQKGAESGKKYPMWENCRYAFHHLCQKEGTGALAICGGDVGLSVLLPFLEAALAGAVAAILVSGRQPGEILLLVAGYVALLQTVRFLQGHLKNRRNKTLFMFRIDMGMDYYGKTVWMDGQSLESARGQKKWQDAKRNLCSGNGIGIEEDSSIIPLHLLELCLGLAQIYVGLFLTADLIDALLAGEYGTAVWRAGSLCGANLLLGLAKHLLQRRFQSLGTKLFLVFYVWLREKVFAMDYESMEKPEAAEKILFSERTSDMYGGLDNLLNHYCNILRAALNILLSVSLVAHLCLTRPSGGSGLVGSLANPLPSLALFAALLLGMCACSFRAFTRFAARQMEIFEAHTGAEEEFSYMLNNVFGNVRAGKIIRIYGMEEMILENTARFERKSRAYFAKMYDVRNAANNANNLVSCIFAVGAYLLAALKVVTGAVTVGAFTRYVGALNQFGSSCFSLISEHGELRKICTTMTDFLAFLDMENPHDSGSIPVEKRDDGEYELAFENVSFHYPGSEELVLKNVDFRLRIKGKLAVVGRNGAGKTTFIKLLCRLYEPTEGRITLNGIDIRKYDEEEYRRIFGVVFQDFKLFDFPVWENLAAGYERDDRRIWEALEQADAADLVRSMEKGLDTWLYKGVEDGVEISGGEAQKLALARALYKDAPVVILDEPTAALDPKAEAEVYERFGQMVEGRTSIYISHRMSSCRFCDEIIVFEDGEIVERGSHESLLAAGGSYARMWEAQAKYYA